ncbi:cytochrome c5 [Flavobacterium sp. HSC-32F16]|uniref:cytochrome c n=1 Tax=Flavobacterium sp. HSC-32F16 TaxID=2910964 RepID=UPI0020A4C488|nr:cytochrome c [Flavobacterium sp. HSC-32F16]MCP2027288.1 cytochrome c5 [Flavobacterium sp. HSC-32F16]
MKLRIVSITFSVLFLAACSSTKSTAVASAVTTPAAETVASVELTPELAEGKNLYENSCVRCHKLYEPTKFSKEEWQPILVRMQKKAKLDDIKMASITNYLHSQL